MQPFDARWPCPFAPLSTLRLPPHSDRRMTRGEGGRLLLPSAGLPPAVLRQLAWRTPVCSLNRPRPRRPFLVGVLQPMSLPPSSAPTATGWSDGVDASPGRHRNVPRWMCRDTTHLKEEASSGTRYHHRDGCGSSSSTVFSPVHRHFRSRTVPFLFILRGDRAPDSPTRLFRAASPS